MNKFYSFVTVLFFGWVAFFFTTQYGVRWEFGPYGLPRTTIAENGWTYLDGTPIDPAILLFVHSGYETAAELVIFSLLAVCIIGNVFFFRRLERTRRDLRKWRDLEASLRRQSPS